MTRDKLRELFVKHHSRRHVARALGWSEWETRKAFRYHKMASDWKDELTAAEIRTAWLEAGQSKQAMAEAMHISPKTAKSLLERIGITPPGRGEWKRRERKQREAGQKRLPASLRTGRMAQVLATWPPLDVWRSSLG